MWKVTGQPRFHNSQTIVRVLGKLGIDPVITDEAEDFVVINEDDLTDFVRNAFQVAGLSYEYYSD